MYYFKTRRDILPTVNKSDIKVNIWTHSSCTTRNETSRKLLCGCSWCQVLTWWQPCILSWWCYTVRSSGFEMNLSSDATAKGSVQATWVFIIHEWVRGGSQRVKDKCIWTSPSLPPLLPSLWGDFTLGSVSNIRQYIDWKNALNSQRNLFPSFSLDRLLKNEIFLARNFPFKGNSSGMKIFQSVCFEDTSE